MNVSAPPAGNPEALDARLGRRFEYTLLPLAILSGLAFLASRFEYLSPTEHTFVPNTFGQLLGVHRVLLQYFVLLPAIPAIAVCALLPRLVGRNRMAFPRLATAAWYCLTSGALLVLWAFMWGRIETGWTYAVVAASTRALLAPTFLLGLILGLLAVQLLGMNLVATVHKRQVARLPLFASSLYWAGWLCVVAMPVAVCALLLALLESIGPLGLFDPTSGGDPELLALLWSFVETPIRWIILLPALGACCAVLRIDETVPAGVARRMRAAFCGLAVLAILGLDLRGVPLTVSAVPALLGSLYQGLALVPLFVLAVGILTGVSQRRFPYSPARFYAVTTVVLIAACAPVELWLGTRPAAGYAAGYFGEAIHYAMIAGGSLFALLALFHAGGAGLGFTASRPGAATGFAVVILAGFVTTFGPMVLLGLHGLPMDLAIYPAAYLAPQILVLAGCTILGAGAIGATVHLLRHRTPATHA